MKKIGWLAIGVFCAACAEASDCRLELGSPFADRMVLQRERSVPVWGWGTPGETVTVEFAGQHKTAKIPASGKWCVDLDPLPACNEGRNLTVWCVGEGAKFLDLMGNEIPAPKTEDGKLRLDDSPVYAVCTH